MAGEMEYHTRCHILNDTHILKVSKYNLTVYRIEGKSRSTTGRLLCQLELPPLAEGFEASYCSSHIQRPPETPDCSPHFQCDPSLTILVLEYDVVPDRTALFVVIPISTMLSQADIAGKSSGPARTISWGDWGTAGARLVLVPYKTQASAHVHVFGSRVALSVTIPSPRDVMPSGSMHEIVVLDVREGAKRVADTGADRGATTKPKFLVLDKYTKEDTAIFASTVEAKMPYRMTKKLYDHTYIHRDGFAPLLCGELYV